MTQECIGNDMLGLLKVLGKSCYALVGHDWGAILAWHFACLFPDAFPRSPRCAMTYPLFGSHKLLGTQKVIWLEIGLNDLEFDRLNSCNSIRIFRHMVVLLIAF